MRPFSTKILVLVTFFLCAFAVPARGEEADIWNRLAFGASSAVITATLVSDGVLGADQASPTSRAIMQKLEENGGQGRYQWVRFKGKAERDNKLVGVVQVISPPRIPIYGSAFNDVFEELNAHGIPVFVDGNLTQMRMSGLASIGKFGSRAEAFFFIAPKGGNLASRHELQHIRDLVTRYDEFRETLPEVPPWLIRLLERQEAGEVLSEREEKILGVVAKHLIFGIGEARASETILKSLFSARGFSEITDPQTWAIEIAIYLNEFSNASLANARLLYGLDKSGLSHSSSKLEIAYKVWFLGLLGVALGVAPIAGGIFALNKLVPHPQKAGTGALRRSLRDCARMVRGLLRKTPAS